MVHSVACKAHPDGIIAVHLAVPPAHDPVTAFACGPALNRAEGVLADGVLADNWALRGFIT